MGALGGVDGALEALEVCHHGAHHTAGQAAAHQQGGHLGVGGVNPVAQEVVNELLRKAAHLHICVHVDVLHLEAIGLHHLLDGDDVGMHLTPGERLYGYVQIICSGAGHLQHGSRGEAGTGVAMVLDLDFRMGLLDTGHNLAQFGRTAHTGHIFEANLVGAVFHQLVHQLEVILYRVHGRVGNGQGCLGNHPSLLGKLDGELEVAGVVEAAKGTGDIRALLLLYLEHKFADIGRNGIHTDTVEAALEHVGLNACLVERSCPLAYGDIGILTIEQIHLLKGAAVGFHSIEASHIHDGRGHPYKLVHTRLVPAGTLPHIPVNQGKLDFSFSHIECVYNSLLSLALGISSRARYLAMVRRATL